MPDHDAEAARSCWDEAAEAWDRFVESGLDYYRTELHGKALLELCDDPSGLDVLDLGCGQGWFTRALASAGGRVVGVDWSRRQIDNACRHEGDTPTGARFEVLDAAAIGERFPASSFDLVTGCMSIMDMPEPGWVLAAAAGLLRPGGRIVISVPNPVTDSTYRVWERDGAGRKLSLKIDRYFEARPQHMDWNMPRLERRFRTVQYRHTLEQWSSMFEAAGLLVARMREPCPDADTVARQPALSDAARVPYFLLFELVPR